MNNLISAHQLAQNINDYLIIDCRFSLADVAWGESQYRQAHIPGAQYAHLDQHLSSPISSFSGRHPLPDFKQLADQLGSWGVDEHTRVVVYDDAGGSYASRLWWLLRTLGHANVAVLDGGIPAWKAAGYALDAHSPEPVAVRFISQINRLAWCDVDQLQAMMEDKLLIDARAKERYDGVSEPIDPVAGHIPGSLNMPVSENIDERGFFKPVEVLRENYLKLMGQIPSTQVIHSCGSGVFACVGVLAMEIAGLPGSIIYPGSWSEWIRDPRRGVARS